jgi:nascent polypeptide-associated complex subunit alpha
MFGGGGGGLDPSKMKQMMQQMGVDFEELDAQRVVIETPEETLVFDDADVNKIGARGQDTYQVVGEPTVEAGGATPVESGDADAADADDADADAIPEEDVEIVAQRAGASKDAARAALAESDGDLAAAIDSLQ